MRPALLLTGLLLGASLGAAEEYWSRDRGREFVDGDGYSHQAMRFLGHDLACLTRTPPVTCPMTDLDQDGTTGLGDQAILAMYQVALESCFGWEASE